MYADGKIVRSEQLLGSLDLGAGKPEHIFAQTVRGTVCRSARYSAGAADPADDASAPSVADTRGGWTTKSGRDSARSVSLSTAPREIGGGGGRRCER